MGCIAPARFTHSHPAVAQGARTWIALRLQSYTKPRQGTIPGTGERIVNRYLVLIAVAATFLLGTTVIQAQSSGSKTTMAESEDPANHVIALQNLVKKAHELYCLPKQGAEIHSSMDRNRDYMALLFLGQLGKSTEKKLAPVRNDLSAVTWMVTEQIWKLKTNPKQDLMLIRLRLENDIQKPLQEAAITIGEVHTDYEEMHIKLMLSHAKTGIIVHEYECMLKPLQQLTARNGGDISATLLAADQLHAELLKYEAIYNGEQVIPEQLRQKLIQQLKKTKDELNKLFTNLQPIIEYVTPIVCSRPIVETLEAFCEFQMSITNTLDAICKQEAEVEKLRNALNEFGKTAPQ
jgi:hypothetical protein